MSKKKNNQSNVLKTIAWILASVAISMSALAVGYYIGFEDAKQNIERENKKEQDRLALLEKKENVVSKKLLDVNNRLKSILEIEQKQELAKQKVTPKEVQKEISKVKEYAGASHEYASEPLSKPPSRVKREVKRSISKKPKLAIIMDDVSVKSQVDSIKKLGLNITMSFLPPSKSRPNSAKLAENEKFYMVHLPMEAQSFSAEEPNTLRVSSSQDEIFQRVKKIKELFPKVRYINNHTGSKYTQSETAMNRLVSALNKNNISFLDSRTTGKTKVPKVMKNFGMKYVARDVFLDHHMDKPYIKKQIRKAIKIAKSEGLAIAIGHPHKNTILALRESKKMFKDIDLVFINQVY